MQQEKQKHRKHWIESKAAWIFFFRKSLVHDQYSSEIKRTMDQQYEKKTRSSQRTDLNYSRMQILSRSPGPDRILSTSGAAATILSNPLNPSISGDREPPVLRAKTPDHHTRAPEAAVDLRDRCYHPTSLGKGFDEVEG